MTVPEFIADGSGPDGNPRNSNETDIDAHALGQQLTEFEAGDQIEFYLNSDEGTVRVRGTVDEVHTTPGNPDGILADFDEQFAVNIEDDSFEEAGDIRSWNISTQLRDGEWSQPSAAGWLEEENDFVELPAQPVTAIERDQNRGDRPDE